MIVKQVTESVCSPQPLASHNRPLMLANVSVYVCDGVLHTEELASARVCVKEREFVCVYNNHQNKKRFMWCALITSSQHDHSYSSITSHLKPHEPHCISKGLRKQVPICYTQKRFPATRHHHCYVGDVFEITFESGRDTC